MKNNNWMLNYIYIIFLFSLSVIGCKENIRIKKDIGIILESKVKDSLHKKDSAHLKSLDSLNMKKEEKKKVRIQNEDKADEKTNFRIEKCKTKNLDVSERHKGYIFEYAGSYYENKYKYSFNNDTLIIYGNWGQSIHQLGGIYFKITDTCVKYLGYVKYVGSNTIYNQSRSFISSNKETNSFALQEWKKGKRIVGVASIVKHPNSHHKIDFKVWLELNENNIQGLID